MDGHPGVEGTIPLNTPFCALVVITASLPGVVYADDTELNPVNKNTQEDMDITIKSEPDNYTSCSVKLEHLMDGFLTILENIKVDTNTQEDVDIIIKSEMDDFKPCCVKLEYISDSFITTEKHMTEVNVLNMEEQGGLVEKKGALNGLWGEVNVLDMEVLRLRRNVMKKGALARLRGEVSVSNMEWPRLVKKRGALNRLW
uniref:Uncharacterized protein n=1 Tax=Timema tahoe TaxID=61484 RepID=A0A7R9P1A0_9NEOP|nr:unnamed protein product [Timema tahoe]